MSCEALRDRIAVAAATGVRLDDEVERHLASCDACRAEETELRSAAHLLRVSHVLESTRSRRAPLFARPASHRAVGSLVRLAAVVAFAAAIFLIARIASGPRTRLEWSGPGRVVSLDEGRARLLAGSTRFETSGPFVVETPLAYLTGERATFVATLKEDTSMQPSVKRSIIGGAGAAAAIALVVVVESGTVEVHRGAAEPARRIDAGETQVITPTKAPPTALRETGEMTLVPVAPASTETLSESTSVADPMDSPARSDDTKRGSCHGVLVFDDGAPVADETVWLWGTPHVVSRTDERGFFRIDRDWVGTSPRQLMVGTDATAINAGEVVLVVDDDREVRFTIPRGIELEIAVTGESGSPPLAGIGVFFRRRDEPVAPDREGSAFGITGADGLIHFRHLHRSPYLVEVREKGWRHYFGMVDLSAEALGARYSIRLRPADTLTVHVDGWTLGEAGEASLQLMPKTSGSLEDRWGSVDANGNFVTDSPEAGDYVVTLSCNGWSATSNEFVVPERGSVDVHVRQPSGEVVAGVVVTSPLESLRRGRVQLHGVEDIGNREAPLDESGNFRIEHVSRGRHRVRFEFEEQSIVGSPEEIDVPDGGLAGVVIRLSGGAIAGRVVGAPELGPVLTSHLQGEQWVEKGYLRPDVDGSFRGSWLAPGRWRLSTTRSRGGYARPVEVDVKTDETTSGVVLEWRSCPTVELVLSRKDGTPVVGRHNALLMPLGSRGWATSLLLEFDERGRVVLNDVPPGSWNLRVYGVGEHVIDVVDGPNPPIEVTLEE